MITLLSRTRRTLTLATFLALAACGDDIVQPTAGTTCDAGELLPGESRVGTFSDESCVVPFHFYSTNAAPYATYRVTLEAGKGYWFYQQQIPDAEGNNSVDAVLTLWGTDRNGASIPLAVSDDEADGIDGRDAEFYFVAPRSGTFNLVAAAYDIDDIGGYRLRMEECPVVAVTDTAGVYDLRFAASNCIRHSIVDTDEPSRIVLVAVKAGPDEIVFAEVTSGDFSPRIEIGGTGFDVFNNIYQDTDFSQSTADPALVSVFTPVAGTLTLAVGASVFDPSGAFEVEITRAAAFASVTAAGDEGTMLRYPARRTAKR